MGNIHSFDRGALSPAEKERLLRRTKKFGHGRAELARSDLRVIPQLSQNPFLDAIFRLYDTDGDGLLLAEDIERLIERLKMLREDRDAQYKFAFEVFDTNRDGFIDKKELMNVLKYTNKRNMTVDQIDQVSTILIGGETKNGKMDFESFRKLMLESSSSSKLIL